MTQYVKQNFKDSVLHKIIRQTSYRMELTNAAYLLYFLMINFLHNLAAILEKITKSCLLG